MSAPTSGPPASSSFSATPVEHPKSTAISTTDFHIFPKMLPQLRERVSRAVSVAAESGGMITVDE
jgi:hypothetical protein